MYITIPLHISHSTESTRYSSHRLHKVLTDITLKVPWTWRWKARGANCSSLLILSWYLLSPFLIPTTPHGCPAALHHAYHQVGGWHSAFAFTTSFFFFLFTACLMSWNRKKKKTTKQQTATLFFLFTTAVHITESTYAASPMIFFLRLSKLQFFQSPHSGLFFLGHQPINLNPSWRKIIVFLHGINFMHFLHCLYSLIRYLPFSQQQSTVDSHSA